jgi:hypothetical protein
VSAYNGVYVSRSSKPSPLRSIVGLAVAVEVEVHARIDLLRG